MDEKILRILKNLHTLINEAYWQSHVHCGGDIDHETQCGGCSLYDFCNKSQQIEELLKGVR